MAMKYFVRVKSSTHRFDGRWVKFHIARDKISGLPEDRTKATMFETPEEAQKAIDQRNRQYADDKLFEILGFKSDDEIMTEVLTELRELGIISDTSLG